MIPHTAWDDEAVELLEALVAIPSVSGQEAEAVAFLAGWMNDHGIAARVDAVGNCVGVRGEGEKEILLLGHIDTFPGVVPVRRDGTVLYGRGAVDAKGPLCTFAVAAARLAVPPNWRVTVVGAVEEESASSRGARQMIGERQPDRHPTYCVIGEPSGHERVTIAYKGRLLVDIELRAPFSHSAGPERSPAERGVELWRCIQKSCTTRTRTLEATSAFDALSPSLRRFRTEEDGAYGTARFTVGIRLPPSNDPLEVEHLVVSAVERAVRTWVDGAFRLEPVAAGGGQTRYRSAGSPGQDGEIAVTCSFAGHEWAVVCGKANPLVRSFLATLRGRGLTPRFVRKTGTSDMNVVAVHWPHTPLVAYGPGDSSLDHTPHEHIDLERYCQAVSLLHEVMERLVGRRRD